jgi:hypothetical protein
MLWLLLQSPNIAVFLSFKMAQIFRRRSEALLFTGHAFHKAAVMNPASPV